MQTKHNLQKNVLWSAIVRNSLFNLYVLPSKQCSFSHNLEFGLTSCIVLRNYDRQNVCYFLQDARYVVYSLAKILPLYSDPMKAILEGFYW